MKKINSTQLLFVLGAVNRPTAISLTTFTPVETLASYSGAPIFKVSNMEGVVAKNYQNRVNEKIAAQGQAAPTFQAASRKWGVRVTKAVIQNEKTGEYYLEVFVKKAFTPTYLVRKAAGMVLAAKSSIEKFMKAKSGSGRQASAGLTENQVIVRTIKLANISRVTIGGEEYEVTQSAIDRAALQVTAN